MKRVDPFDETLKLSCSKLKNAKITIRQRWYNEFLDTEAVAVS